MSKLSITEQLIEQVSGMDKFTEKIKKIKGETPMPSITISMENLRDDEAGVCFTYDQTFLNAKNKRDGYFTVPLVVE